MKTDALRTPDERFSGLPGWPYAPHYVDDLPGYEGLRVHYVDEGPQNAVRTYLCLHGQPSWSYLYRKMIPVFLDSGARVIAPDWLGFGRSDKPVADETYTFHFHRNMMLELVKRLDLQQVTLVCQDWGGLLGLRLVAENPDRFARVVVANTGLPTGDQKMSEAFLAWQRFSQESPDFQIGRIVGNGTAQGAAPEVVAAYDAPFPDDRYTAGARIFPTLVPTSPDDPAAADNRAAWEVLSRWEKPFLTAFSDSDAITRGGERVFQKLVPGAQGMPHTTLAGGGHFLQEDVGPELARVVADLIAATPR